MPGIDRSRVVGKEDDELDYLICGICHDIFDGPVVTQCCRQMFCKICIYQWLEDSNTCPIDRNRLTLNELLSPSLMVTNLLNKLKIKCENYGNGCQSIVSNEEMANHMKVCKTCDSCKSSEKLLAEKQEEIEILRFNAFNDKIEIDQLKDQIRDLKVSNIRAQRTELDALKEARVFNIRAQRREEKLLSDKQKEVNDIKCQIQLLSQKLNDLTQINKILQNNLEIKQKESNELKSKSEQFKVSNLKKTGVTLLCMIVLIEFLKVYL